MPKAVIVNYRDCTGYRICELTCSVKNEGTVSYELRGWDKNTGIPRKEKLRELKLDFVNV